MRKKFQRKIPISVTLGTFKTIRKILLYLVSSFLNSNKLHALIQFTESVHYRIDVNKNVTKARVDLSREFDSI